MEESRFSLEEFSTEIGEIEVKKVRQFDRMWKTGAGGSIGQKLLIYRGKVYFGSANRNLYCVDARTGKEVWKYRTDGFILLSSPVSWKGKIIVGSYDRHIYCFDADTGELAWKFKTEGEIACVPTVSDGVVYVGSRDENLYAIDAENGRLVWKFRTRDQIVSAAAVHGGKVFIGSFDRNMYCLDASNGRMLWKLETQGEIFVVNPPPIKDGVIYFGSFDGNLRAVDAGTGRLKWKLKMGQYGLDECPVIHGDRLYMGTREGQLACVSIKGRLIWKLRVSLVDMTCPTIYKGRLYIGSGDYNLYCLDLEGRLVWKFKTQGVVWWFPAVFENRIYFPSWDCNLYCVDADTGKLVFTFRSAGSPSYLPPPHEIFEVEFRIPESELEEEMKKTYDLDFGQENENASAYKSRITYQVSTQYASKGKYQVDTNEEEF